MKVNFFLAKFWIVKFWRQIINLSDEINGLLVSYCNRKSKQAFFSFLYTFAVFFSYNVSHMRFYRCGFPFFGLTADVIEGK